MLKKFLIILLLSGSLEVISAERAASAESSDGEVEDLEVGQINNDGKRNMIASMVGGFSDNVITESRVRAMLDQYKLEVTKELSDKMSKLEWQEALTSLDQISDRFNKAISEKVDARFADALSKEIQKFNAQIALSIQQQMVIYAGRVGKLEADMQAQAVRLAAIERARRNDNDDQQGCCYPFLKCFRRQQRAGNNVVL